MFIVFEGHDGVGKTTQATLLEQSLSASGKEVVSIRSPGGSHVAEDIRALALMTDAKRTHAERLTPRSRMLLMAAACMQTWETLIRPSLLAGKVVIMDRWLWSGYLYQVVGEGVSFDTWKAVYTPLFEEEAFPDLTLVLAMDETDRLDRKRVRTRVETSDVMETQPDGFEHRISTAIQHNDQLLHFTSRMRHMQLLPETTREDLHDEINQVVQSLALHGINWNCQVAKGGLL